MVRLKVDDLQFEKRLEVHFNSSMVRLKDLQDANLKCTNLQFQFQYGTIKRPYAPN